MGKSTEIVIPVFMPTESGVSEVELATARFASDTTLVMEFRGNAPGIAISRMLKRGVMLGLSFVMAEASGGTITPEERDEQDRELLKTDEVTGDDILG